MAEIKIICPNCGKRITLSEALTHQLEGEISERVQAETKEEYARKLTEETTKFQEGMEREQEKLKQVIEERYSFELSDLREQVKEKDEKLDKIRQRELELLKYQRELEDKQKTLEIEVTQRVDEETRNIAQKITEKVAEEYRMKNLEKDKQLSDMKKQIEELKRKSEQGSQQTQGEVLELELEKELHTAFPDDEIKPVGKGVSGADIIHKVFTKSGSNCGTIIWECKNAKRWSDTWLTKLRDDLRSKKANLAILVTTTMPKNITQFAQQDGIWVTEFSYAIGLASALRTGLIEVANAKFASVGKGEKIELLYDYLSGSEFRQRVEAIVESFVTLREDLDQEKRAMEQVWAKREKQIYRAVHNVAGMYGDMKGIIGIALPKIGLLELPVPDEIAMEIHNANEV